LATVLQIEDYWGDDRNPYQHNSGDTIARMNLDYWEEQIKATLVTAAYLAVPITVTYTEQVYLPVVLRSFPGQEDLRQPKPRASGCFRCRLLRAPR